MKAIPFFPDAHLAKTGHLTLAEHGALLRLYMHAWMTLKCSLPNDDRRIARILGVTLAEWKKLKEAVMAFWMLVDDVWIQPRLLQEWHYVREKSLKAQASAKKRWDS